MAKIIHFPNSQAQNPVDFLNESRDIAADSEVESVIVCFKCKDGTVMTGYLNADFGVKQEMLGHIQCDVIDQMIRANPERYQG